MWDFLDQHLFEIAGTSITVMTAITFVFIVLVTLIAARILDRAVLRALQLRKIEDEGTLGVISRLVHYLVLIIGFGIAVDTIGISLGALFAAGALFAVALGFAMQNIAQNFVSGVILLLERSIKPGDVLSVQDRLVRVSRMGIRATVARSLDDDEIIIPNSELVQNSVRNLTLRDRSYRIRTTVGVVYSSDMALVARVLDEAARATSGRAAGSPVRVLMTEFGSSSVDFEVSIWTNEPWKSRQTRSALNTAIWNATRASGVTIAFPQLDVHFDAEVNESLRSALADVG